MPLPSWITTTPGHGGGASGVARKNGSEISAIAHRRTAPQRPPGPQDLPVSHMVDVYARQSYRRPGDPHHRLRRARSALLRRVALGLRPEALGRPQPPVLLLEPGAIGDLHRVAPARGAGPGASVGRSRRAPQPPAVPHH